MDGMTTGRQIYRQMDGMTTGRQINGWMDVDKGSSKEKKDHSSFCKLDH